MLDVVKNLDELLAGLPSGGHFAARDLRELLAHTVRQQVESGRDLSPYADQVRAAFADESTPDSTYAGLVDRLDALPASPDWPYDEPDDLVAIQSATGPLPATALQDGDMRRRDRVRGAWLGRSAGCLREALDWVVAAGRDGAGWSDVLAAIQERYAGMSGIHTINNAAIIAAALLWGEGDFTRSVGFSATAGWDTDSNGATVGSTVGAVLGAEALPAHWVDPLGDRLHSALFGHAVNSISDLADRTVAQRARFGGS